MILVDTSTRIEIQEFARENIMKSKTLQEAALDLPPNELADLARRQGKITKNVLTSTSFVI